MGKGRKSPCDSTDLGRERCFRFSILFGGGEGGTSGSDAELSAACPESGLEWAEARLDCGAAALRPMLRVWGGNIMGFISIGGQVRVFSG